MWFCSVYTKQIRVRNNVLVLYPEMFLNIIFSKCKCKENLIEYVVKKLYIHAGSI